MADVLHDIGFDALREPAARVVVASSFSHGGRDRPAAAGSLLAGELRRRGYAADIAPLRTGGEWTALVAPTEHGVWAAAVRPGDEPALRAIGDALAAWRLVAGPRTLVLASPRSFCAGVERAIGIVEHLLAHRGGPVYVRRQIVHNKHVVARLEAEGAVFVDELDQVPRGETVVFSAHGVAPAVRAQAADRELAVVDATCPLVAKVHSEARRYSGRGDTVVLIGKASHEEIVGVRGEAPESIVVVGDEADVDTIDVRDPERVSYLTQTTLAVDETTAVVAALRARFPTLRGPEAGDICYAATNRQRAVHAVAERSDLVLVIGSTNSANSVHLVDIARRLGSRAHLVDDPADVRPEWLAGSATVGLTAGASAPSHLVDQMVSALSELGPARIEHHETVAETIHFGLPASVRNS